MTEQQVVDIMKSSRNEREWNSNIETVKAAFGGDYPPFWYKAIIAGGIRPQDNGNKPDFDLIQF